MKKILTFALISMFPISAGQAQEQLTLQKAIQIALEKNIDVIQSKNAMESSEANITRAYGEFMPSLNASAGIGRNGSTTSTSIGDVIRANGSASAGVSANVTLFNGFRNFSGLNRANSAADAAVYNYAVQRQTKVLTVQMYYLSVLEKKSLLDVAVEELKRSQQQLAKIIEQNKVGSVAKADVYRQQTQTATAELAVINSQSDYDNSKQDLLYLLATDVTKEFLFEDQSVLQQIQNLNVDSLQQEYADYNKLVQEALASRPDYQSSILAKQISANDLSIARSGHYPTLGLSADYGFAGNDLGTLTDSKTWGWRVSLSVPIFSGFQTSTSIQTSQLNYDLAELQLEQAKRSVAKDVKVAMLKLESARKRYDVELKRVASAEEDRRIAEERYNLGSNTLLDLLVATSNYTQAQSNKVSASYNFVNAKLQFRIAIGREKY